MALASIIRILCPGLNNGERKGHVFCYKVTGTADSKGQRKGLKSHQSASVIY